MFTPINTAIIILTLPTTVAIPRKDFSKYSEHTTLQETILSNVLPITAGYTYTIAIIPGAFFSDNARTLGNVEKEISSRGWLFGEEMSPAVPCILNDFLSNQNYKEWLGFGWLISMHQPIKDSSGDSGRLSISRGSSSLGMTYYTSDTLLPNDRHFLCVVNVQKPPL